MNKSLWIAELVYSLGSWQILEKAILTQFSLLKKFLKEGDDKTWSAQIDILKYVEGGHPPKYFEKISNGR